MTWDNYNGPTNYFSTLPIDRNSPPGVGECARLTKEDFEFKVRINSIGDSELSGVVEEIGPVPTLEALGVRCGQEVFFKKEHISTLYRT